MGQSNSRKEESGRQTGRKGVAISTETMAKRSLELKADVSCHTAESCQAPGCVRV